MTIDSTIDQQIAEAQPIATPAAEAARVSDEEMRAPLRCMAEAGAADLRAVNDAARASNSIFPTAQEAADNLVAGMRAMREEG